MKIYFNVSITGTCMDKCIYKYIGKNPYNVSGVKRGSKACQDCYNFQKMGIDDGGDYIYCIADEEGLT